MNDEAFCVQAGISRSEERLISIVRAIIAEQAGLAPDSITPATSTQLIARQLGEDWDDLLLQMEIEDRLNVSLANAPPLPTLVERRFLFRKIAPAVRMGDWLRSVVSHVKPFLK